MASRWWLAAFVFFGALAAWLQWRAGAWQSDFSAHEDEPAHVVSALMIRDYVAKGFPGAPFAFAENYYVHYPKIAIGHWPPVFHMTLATAMLVFGRTKIALLLTMAILGGALAASLLWWTERYCGAIAAGAVTLLLSSAAFVRASEFAVMPDLLLALLLFWAVAAYGLYLENGRRRFLAMYAALALLALFTHGRGAVVFFVPLLANLFVRRTVVISAVGLAALVGIALTLPVWFYLSYPLTPELAIRNGTLYLRNITLGMGWAVALASAAGLFFALRDARRRPAWAAMAALAIGSLLFRATLNTGWEDRYLLPAAAAIGALAALGATSLLRMLPGSPASRRVAGIAVALLALAIASTNLAAPLHKSDAGYHRAAPEWDNPSPVYLVAGDPKHEGAAIAEMALLDPRLDDVVLRATKTLAWSTWSQYDYRMNFSSPAAVADYLDSVHVGVVALQQMDSPPHIPQLAQAIRLGGAKWAELPATAEPAGTRVFRRATPLPPGPFTIRLDMRDKFKKFLELRLGS